MQRSTAMQPCATRLAETAHVARRVGYAMSLDQPRPARNATRPMQIRRTRLAEIHT